MYWMYCILVCPRLWLHLNLEWQCSGEGLNTQNISYTSNPMGEKYNTYQPLLIKPVFNLECSCVSSADIWFVQGHGPTFSSSGIPECPSVLFLWQHSEAVQQEGWWQICHSPCSICWCSVRTCATCGDLPYWPGKDQAANADRGYGVQACCCVAWPCPLASKTWG